MVADIPADWVKAAVAITPGFEVQGDPYQGASGDFDGMGISCGALQWNIGKGSLQPMVKNAGKSNVLAAMPKFGQDMWDACNTTIAKGLSIVRRWQNGTRLKPAALTELRGFMGSPAMRAQQDQRIGKVADVAFNLASGWAKNRLNGTPTKRSFCWFFDIATQNGSLKGLTFTDVARFLDQNKPDRADDVVCDFLGSRTGASGHINDAKKNAQLWRNKADGDKLELLVMSYLRSNTADPKWQHVVLNRKGTIAMGVGWVNSGKNDFAKHGL